MDRAAPNFAALKIVVVEDDATVRLFRKETLEKLGHQVVGEADNGTDMVRTVLELEPDVVIFDIHLPRMNGLDALRQIYQEKIVAAVAITADRDQDLVRRALEEHVLAYLVKPVEAHQLGPALQIAWARFQELKGLTTENASLRQTLQNRKIIDRAIKAHGGAAHLAKLRAGHVKMRGSLELTQTIAFTKEEFFNLPDKVREIQEFDAPGRKNQFLLGFNGERGWLEVNGKVQHLE